jgi:hypothetical protein
MKLIKLDKNLQNEIDISERIKKIPYFFLYYQPINVCKHVKLSQMHEDLLNFSKTDENEKHVLIEKDHKPNFDFLSFFDSIKSNKGRWMHLFYSYTYLLKAIRILNENNIVYFNVSNSKIMFNEKSQPILCNFSQSFSTNSPLSSLQNIEKYQPTVYTLPMEYHIITFLNNAFGEKRSISRANLEEIAKDFVLKNHSLKGLPEEEIKLFYQNCVLTFPIINQPREVITEKMRAYSNTWDNYGLSAVFLPLVKKELALFPKNKFWRGFSQLLLLNMNPDPEKRLDPLKTMTLFEELLSHAHYQDSN